MQRIRETDTGLSVTDELDVVTLQDVREEGLTFRRKRSALDSDGQDPQLHIIGRDNIRDLGDWLCGLAQRGGQEQKSILLCEKSDFTQAILVALDLEEIVTEEENRVLPRACASILVVPDRHRPTLQIMQGYDRLQLTQDWIFPTPYTDAARAGSLILEGLSTIQKKSIW